MNPFIDWEYAPKPNKEIDYYMWYGVKKENYDFTGEELWYEKYQSFFQMYASVIFVLVEEGDCESSNYFEPWEVETLIVRPSMKCWGRGKNK